MKKGRFKKDVLICTILTILTVCFIFWNSLQDSASSDAQSGFFTMLFRSIFGVSEDAMDLVSFVVRKLAHFSEFALLGVEISYLKKRVNRLADVSWAYVLLIGLLVAVTDESLQLLSDRTSSVKDVWLDFFGFTFGLLFLIVIFAIIKKKIKGDRDLT